jgi:hypothetical protein
MSVAILSPKAGVGSTVDTLQMDGWAAWSIVPRTAPNKHPEAERKNGHSVAVLNTDVNASVQSDTLNSSFTISERRAHLV